MSCAVEKLKLFPDKPWIILGKGPSLRWDDDFKNFNILSINDSFKIIPPFKRHSISIILNDIKAIESFSDEILGENTSIFTPYAFNQNCDRARLTDFWIKNSLFFNKFKNNFTYYSPCFNWIKPEMNHNVTAYNSTYESAIWLLGYAGVRFIMTCGIDHSSGYKESFGTSNANYAAVKYYAQVPIDHFKIEVRPV